MIGEALAGALKSRRDALPEFASRYYELITRQIEIQATDKDEYVQCEHLPSGNLLVRIGLIEGPGGERKTPYFQRTFHPEETREVRIYLRGGDDRAEISGTKGRIVVRIDGGGGDDTLTNSSAASNTRFYDSRGKNRFAKGKGAKIDERPLQASSRTASPCKVCTGLGHAALLLAPAHYQDKSGSGYVRARMTYHSRQYFGYRKYPFSSQHFFTVGLGERQSSRQPQ